MGVMPPFVKTNEVISPFDLYEKFDFTSAQGLVSIQFLAAFNIFIGGNKTISKNAMSVFFHNFSIQVLGTKEHRIKTEFDAIEALNKSIKKSLKEGDQNNINFIDFTTKQFKEIKDPKQLFEENIVENIISGNRVEYPQDTDHMSFSNTEQEILEQSKANYKLEKKLARALNESEEIPQ